MELMRALSVLESLETRLASVYYRFSQVFKEDDPAARLFSELAADEESHRQVIQYQQRLVRFNPTLFQAIEVDIGEVGRLVKRCEQMLEDSDVALDAALAFAHDMEFLAAECHMKHALAQSNPELQHLLRKLGRADEDHVKALNTFIRERSLGLPPRG